MMTVKELVLLSILGVVSSEMKVVDLSHPYNHNSVYYPIYSPFNFSIMFRGIQPGGYWLEANTIQLVEHTGTHLDAPAHAFKGGKRITDIPISRLVGPGVVLDVKAAAKKNPDYEVTVEDLQKWESKHGRIPDKAIVLMNSGWSKRYPTKTMVFNSKTPKNTKTFHFPGLGLKAMQWLVANRKINLVGCDTPSLDYGQESTTFPVHTFLFKHGVPGLENVANLDALPEHGATITVGAMKIEDGSGAPTRLIGVYDDNKSLGSRISLSFAVTTVVLVSISGMLL